MSPDNRYKLDLDQLDDAIDKIAQFGATVADWLREVDDHIADLHLSWESDAATAQRDAHQKWMAGSEEMRENLDELRVVARNAHTNCSAAVSTNCRMWP